MKQLRPAAAAKPCRPATRQTICSQQASSLQVTGKFQAALFQAAHAPHLHVRFRPFIHCPAREPLHVGCILLLNQLPQLRLPPLQLVVLPVAGRTGKNDEWWAAGCRS